MKQAKYYLMMLLLAMTTMARAQENGEGYYLIDGVDFHEFGSYIPLEKLVKITDWRGRDFESHPNYWDYYGVTSIDVDRASVECNLNGEWGEVPATILLDVDKTNLTGTYYKKNKEEGTVDSRFGFLTYRNNGTVVNSAFQLRFHVGLTYKWGTLWTSEKIVIEVKPTIVYGGDNASNANSSDKASSSDSSASSNAATAIVVVDMDDATSVWHDLSGRRLQGAPTSKGIYIVNGRKVCYGR